MNKLLLIIALLTLAFVGVVTSKTKSYFPRAAVKTAPIVTINPNLPVAALYDQFTPLTKAERQELFRQMDGKRQAQLWVEHLSRLLRDNTYTVEQRAFLVSLSNRLALVNDLEKEKAVFAKKTGYGIDTATRLFGDAGAVEVGMLLGGRTKESVQQFRYFLNGKPLLNKNCNCSSDPPCMTTAYCGGYCICGGCDVTNTGCGWLLVDPCEGTC